MSKFVGHFPYKTLSFSDLFGKESRTAQKRSSRVRSVSMNLSENIERGSEDRSQKEVLDDPKVNALVKEASNILSRSNVTVNLFENKSKS